MSDAAIMFEAHCTDVEPRRSRPYPTGWFAVCFSHEVAPGAVRTVPFVGGEIVLYRTGSGVLRAVNAYCPHLGAHLGHGGRVNGESLVCPFHGFAYGTGERCLHPARGPGQLRLHLPSWHLREVGGFAFVWYDAAGDAPRWTLPDFDAAGFSRPVFRCLLIGGHMQDSPENAADLGHFSVVHTLNKPAIPSTRMDGPEWHSFTQSLYQDRWQFDFRSVWSGLGCLIADIECLNGRLQIKVLAAPAQIGPLQWTYRFRQALRLNGFDWLPGPLRRGFEAILLRLYYAWFDRQALQDKQIWDHKTQRLQPALAPSEELIAEYRRWAAQFYPPDTTAVPGASAATAPRSCRAENDGAARVGAG